MKKLSGGAIFASVLACGAVCAQQMNGKMPMYPGGRNLNDMPPAAVAAGVPMVQETADPVATVDAWYVSKVGTACQRTAQSGGIKFQCATGSIMIYSKSGKTQIALVPSMPF
jgi:hypothetical protein